jgi:tetratricopeptide (TPR) repeat protein
VPTIGRKLNVAAVLEGSVRKSGSRVRITAQLIDTSNGYHLWSDNFDRDLTDILALQTEIATAVTHALKLELLGDLATKLRYGSTENAAAYDAYLRGLALMKQRSGEANDRASLAAFDEAVRLDPAFALAHAAGAVMIASVAVDWTADYTEFKRLGDEARLRARRAIALAPELGAVHEAEVIVIDRTSSLDFAAARSAARRAMELEPGNVAVLTSHALVEGRLGRSAAALESAARAIALDPLSDRAWRMQGIQLYYAHRHEEARRSLQQALALQPGQRVTNAWIALNDLVSGEIEAAIEVCATDESWNGRQCLAIAYHMSKRHAEADELLQRLKMEFGDTLAYQYAEIHAQRGETGPALEWLRTAVRVMDPGLGDLRVNPLLAPLRAAPDFKEIEASLGFPPL